jgi:hypothetical protein
MMRWGMSIICGANIRNTSSPHWRGRLKGEKRWYRSTVGGIRAAANPETKKDVVWLPSMTIGRYSPSPKSIPSSKVTVEPIRGLPIDEDWS